MTRYLLILPFLAACAFPLGCAAPHHDTPCDNTVLRADRTCDRDNGNAPTRAMPTPDRPEPPKGEPPKHEEPKPDKEPNRELNPDGWREWKDRQGIGG